MILGIAVGLAMDALAVSVANGCAISDMEFPDGFRMALFFGFFQGLMPVLGWMASTRLHALIQAFDHWIAFVLLAAIGGHMIWETLAGTRSECVSDCRRLPTLFLMSVATSIDALAVGITFGVLGLGIVRPALIIGMVTFALCLPGARLGRDIGRRFQQRLGLLGGSVLIGIGCRILYQHLTMHI